MALQPLSYVKIDPVAKTVTRHNVPPAELSLDALQELVGGYIEVAARPIGGAACNLVVNEEARLQVPLPKSFFLLTDADNRPWYGTVIVLGPADVEGEFTSCMCALQHLEARVQWTNYTRPVGGWDADDRKF